MLITPKLINKKSVEKVLEEIETSLYTISATELDGIRWGVSVNTNYSKVNDLLTYRDILFNKSLGCNCLDEYSLESIIGKVNNLLKSSC